MMLDSEMPHSPLKITEAHLVRDELLAQSAKTETRWRYCRLVLVLIGVITLPLGCILGIGTMADPRPWWPSAICWVAGFACAIGALVGAIGSRVPGRQTTLSILTEVLAVIAIVFYTLLLLLYALALVLAILGWRIGH